jgi:hypothetical protein
MIIIPEGSELFHANEQRDREYKSDSRFRNFVNA